MPFKSLVPGIFKDDRTKEILTSKQFLAREGKEWGAAVGRVTKECFGFTERSTTNAIVLPEKQLRELLKVKR